MQASEKVFQDFRLEVTNPGGHSSLPVKDNAIYHLAEGLARLAAFEFPVRAERGDARLLRALGGGPDRSEDGGRHARRGAADAGLGRRGAAVGVAARTTTRMMRTTCVATRLQGGHANNALPQMASANVNCRILPGVSPASVKDKLVEVLGRSEDQGGVRRRGATRASRRRCART